MKKYVSIFIALLFILVCIFLLSKKENLEVKNYTFVKINNDSDLVIKAEVVDTVELRNLGLSGREGMRDDEGMLFVFDKVGNYPFWMKDMNFAIDIIWLDENKKIVYIEYNALPASFPNTFGGEEPAQYVLEVVGGFAKQNNLKVGDTLEF